MSYDEFVNEARRNLVAARDYAERAAARAAQDGHERLLVQWEVRHAFLQVATEALERLLPLEQWLS